MSVVLGIVIGDFPQLGQIDLGVDLGGAEVAVPQQFLQGGEGSARPQQLTGESMTKLMTAGGDSGLPTALIATSFCA